MLAVFWAACRQSTGGLLVVYRRSVSSLFISSSSPIQAIKEWRKLPHIVSQIHIPLLQAAQQIMELQEAAQISQGLQVGTVLNVLRASLPGVKRY